MLVGKCACPLLLMCLFVCMSSNATAEAMADDTDSHPTVLLQEYTTARAIPVRTALLVQDASIVRLIRSVMSDPAFLCFFVCVFCGCDVHGCGLFCVHLQLWEVQSVVIITTNAPPQRVRLVGFSFEGGGMRGNGLEFGEWGRRV